MTKNYILNDFKREHEYTPEEQKAHRKAWIEALRSGDFKQTTGRLKSRNGGLCCLGVACVVAGIAPTYDEYNEYYFDEEEYRLSDDVKMYFGLSDNDGEFIDPEITENASLIYLNDDLKYDFNQIANVIESEPEDLVQ